jgi:hypothetical protein
MNPGVRYSSDKEAAKKVHEKSKNTPSFLEKYREGEALLPGCME